VAECEGVIRLEVTRWIRVRWELDVSSETWDVGREGVPTASVVTAHGPHSRASRADEVVPSYPGVSGQGIHDRDNREAATRSSEEL
jgi:hypothetical protein